MKFFKINLQKILILLLSFLIIVLYLLLFFIKIIHAAAPASISSVDLTATTCSSTIANGVTAARAGDSITINGSNFTTTTGSATVNGSTFTISSWSNTAITGVISNTGTLTGNIVVTVGPHTATFAFTLLPCIMNLSSTTSGVGSSVTINGNEFGSSPGTGNYDTSTNNITLNGVAIPTGDVTSWSTSGITFTVPSGSTSGNVIVTASSSVSNAVNLNIVSYPNSPTSLTQSTTGGSLVANTYYYKVAALTANGETPLSAAVSIVVTGSTSQNKISWDPVVGAVSYDVYRGIGSSTMIQYINTSNTYLVDNGYLRWHRYSTNFISQELPQVLSSATSVIYDGYVYVMGGYNASSGTLSTVYYAAISSTGGVGAWSTSTNPLPTTNANATSVEYGGYVYVMGGANSSGTFSTVYYAPLSSTGGVGAWSTSTNPLPQVLSSATSVIYDGYVYVMGGDGSSGSLSTVYYAPLSSTGGVGAWSTSTNSLPQVLYNATSVEYGGYVYVMGGYNGSSSLSTVYYAPLSSTGGVGAWSTSTNSLPQVLYNATSVEYGGYVYVMGGYNGSSSLSTLYYAPISSTGGVGSWSTSTNSSLLQTLDNTVSVTYDGYIYVMGGYNGSANSADVYYASLSINGGLGTWNTSPNSLPQVLNGATAVTYDGYVYVMGGYNGSSEVSTVYYASLSSTGGVGVWSTSTNSLPTTNANPTSVTYDGYVYVMAGYDGSYLSTVYYAPLSSTGGVGAWSTSSNSIPQILSTATSVTYDGYVYVMGGYNGTTCLSTVYYAPLSSTGGVGAWSTSTNSLPQLSKGATAVEYRGYVYVIGGQSTASASYSATVYYASLSSTGGVGTWSTSSNSLPNAIAGVSSVVYGGYVYIIGGYGSNAEVSTVYYDYINSLSGVTSAYTNTNENIINWTAVTGATEYKIYRGTSSGSENLYFTVKNGSQTSFNDSGNSPSASGSPPTSGGTAPSIASSSTSPIGGYLPYNTNYYYKVTAITSAGESLPSTEVTLITDAPIPVPTGIGVVNSTVASSTIISGTWINSQSLTVGATISSPNSTDTLNLLVEVEPNGTAFTNSTTNFVTSGVGVYKSSAYSYSGTAITGNLLITGLSSNTQYHWQVAVMGLGGTSSWVAMGGNPDFGVDTTGPLSNGISMLAWSSAPTSIFSNGFESGTILTSASPAGAWTSDGGSSLPLIQNNIQGPVLQGNYSVNMATSSGGTSYITNNTFNTSSAQIRFYVDIQAVSFAAVGDSITLLKVSNSTGVIGSLNLLDSSSGVVLETVNSIGGTSVNGNTSVLDNRWNSIVLDITASSTAGSMNTYLNGSEQGSLTSQNTGSTNITTLSFGAVTDSTSDSINMNIDNINVQNTAGLTQLSYDTATAYEYTTPYFEFLGGYDMGSGINNYGVYFGQSSTGYPTTTQSTQGYSSTALSTNGMYYLNVILYDNVGNASPENINFEYNFMAPTTSAVPNAPTALEQLASNGTTKIANGSWTSSGVSTNIVFQFSMSSPNSTDTLTPEIEIEPNGTAFTGTPNYTGTAVSYSGTAVTGIVDVTGLSNCAGYHWQAFVKNSSGLSNPVVFNSTNPNFSVSNSAPTAGTVYDGNVNGTEISSTESISTIDANWTGFSDTCSGLAATPYEVGIGTTSGGDNIYAFSSNGIVLNNPSPYNTVSITSLPLQTGETYYITVIATNNAGLTTSVTSPGQSVMPTLSFSINSTNVNLGNWNSTNSYTTTNTTTLSVLTNAYNGYSVLAYESNLMTSAGGNTIPNFSAGSYASPAAWSSGEYGFGYTSSATNINGVNLFSNGTLYAPFSLTGPGDTVAQNQTNITGANYSSTPTSYTITYKAAVSSGQPAGQYQTNIIYTIVSSF